MSLNPYIEIYPFTNDFNPAYPRDMWQVIENDLNGEIIKARTAFTKKEAELIKYKFSNSTS